MKNRPSLPVLMERIERFGPLSGGVFSYAELFSLINTDSDLQNKRTIRRLVKEGILFKIQRGFYTTKNPDLWMLACRIKKGAYISMDSVLAKNGLIGTVPEKAVSVVYPGIKKQTLKTPFGILRFFSIQKNLIFGLILSREGVLMADSEKATLDLLYYYTKGARFVMDPRKEINLRKLNHKKIAAYLKYYRNPKFIKFVKGEFNEIA